MPFISKMEQQPDYSRFPPTTPIVIDNGSCYFRIGWAGEREPRVIFRHYAQKPRLQGTERTVIIAGDRDPGLLKYFDLSCSTPLIAFDKNVVVCHFETMKYILDCSFSLMGASRSQTGQIQIDHPVLITECVDNPVHSRSKMAELLFKTYGVPSIAFGVDAAFSYKYNQQLEICGEDGLAICSGFITSRVIPFVEGEPIFEGSCVTNVGGFHITDYLQELPSLKHPHHTASLTWEKVEDLMMEHCYIAHNCSEEAWLFQKGSKEAENKTRYWQLPSVPHPTEEPPSEEEIAKIAEITERQGQRLKEMAEAERSSRISKLQKERSWAEYLLELLKKLEKEVRASFRKAKGEQKAEQSENDKKDDEQELLRRARRNQEEEQRFLQNPELYLEQMRVKYIELYEKYEQQKRLKTNAGNTNGNNTSGGAGCGERVNAAQRERLRILTTAASDQGKGEDTFGPKDEDWQLNKLISKDNHEDSDGGADRDEAEPTCISSRLQEIDPAFVPKPSQASAEVPRLRPLTKEDSQIVIGVERFRCPEVLFRPNLIDRGPLGLDEIAMTSLTLRMPSNLADRLTSSILLTGGSCLVPDIIKRMETEIQKVRSCKVVMASDPVLDAWRGASTYASNSLFPLQTFSRRDYDENGENWLREYHPRYTL